MRRWLWLSPCLARRRTVLALVAALLAIAGMAAACGDSDDNGPGVEIRDLAEILDGEVEVTNITSSTATVRVTTSIPVVCSVVYGEDETYGQQSTDMDMGGTPHLEHAAPLRGLEPDTTYTFRLQGSDASGVIYVSEPMTFRTPADTAGEQDGRQNLASAAEGARILDASSVFGNSSAWAAENAIDGDPSTEWSSAGDGDGAFIEVALDGEHQIAAVGAWTRTMGASGEITQFRVVTDRGEVLGPFDLLDADRLYEFPVTVTAASLRFEAVTSTGGNTGFVAIAAYAAETP